MSYNIKRHLTKIHILLNESFDSVGVDDKVVMKEREEVIMKLRECLRLTK